MKKPHKKIYLGKYIFTVLLLLAAAGVWYWYAVAGKSDEALIGKAIAALASDLSKNKQESTATALLKVKGIAGAFADPMTLGMDQYAFGSYDRERLLASIGRYRAMISRAEVTASDITVEMLDKEHAKVYFSGRFAGELKNGMSDTIVKDIEAESVKIDGKWLIKSMKFRSVLH